MLLPLKTPHLRDVHGPKPKGGGGTVSNIKPPQ
jgi:hypothetical protein